MTPESTDAKLASDAVEITTGASQTLPKVQLDIDDAPFLREAETPPPSPTVDQSDEPLEVPPPPVVDEAARRKKKLVISAAVLVVLLAGCMNLWWFVLRTPVSPPPDPQVVVVPSSPQDSAPVDFLIPLAPFWLELQGDAPRDKDKIFFLVCKFTAVSKSEAVSQEARNKVVVIRDALYFYLKNKSYAFLTDPGNTQTIKNDLSSVINAYLAGGKVDDVLFERYLSK